MTTTYLFKHARPGNTTGAALTTHTMLTRDEIIKEFTTNIKAFEQYAYNIAGEQDAADLFQEVTLMLLEFSEARLQGYYNPKQGLKPIFIRMLCLQYKSQTSKFHKEYRKQNKFINKSGKDITYNEQSTELEAFTVPYNDMLAARDNVHIHSGEMFTNELENLVFLLYCETGSLRKTLAALPDKDRDLFDLKKVHEIVKKFRRTIKKQLNK